MASVTKPLHGFASAASALMASVTKPLHGFASMPEHGDKLSYEFPSGEWECIAPSVDGWVQAMDVVERIAQEQCEGCTPMSGGSYRSNRNIVYRFRCSFWNSHGCRWECRFVLKHDDMMYGPEKDLEKRAFHHRNHAIQILMLPATKHVDHMTLGAKGPPPAWIPFARKNPDAMRWKKKKIVLWLHGNNFPDAQKLLLARIQGHSHIYSFPAQHALSNIHD